jgi:hypothetical protein
MALANSGRIAVTGGVLSWDVLDVTESGHALQVNKVEVSNNTGASIEIGWGEELPAIVGKIDTGVFSEITLPYTFAAGEFLAILAPKKFDALQVVVDTAAGAAMTMGVYDGSDLVTLTAAADSGALTFDGGTPVVEAVIDPINGWVQGGVTGYEGFYAMVSDDAEDLEISSVRIGRVIDFVSTVADGNHAFREYSIEPLSLAKNQGLFVYTSDADNDSSIATIDYAQI